jgi:hypothetical protein
MEDAMSGRDKQILNVTVFIAAIAASICIVVGSGWTPQ